VTDRPPEEPRGERFRPSAAPDAPLDVDFGDAWTYESIVGALPGLDLRGAPAVAVQIGLFELLVLGLGWYYGLGTAMVAGTVAVVVAGAGSVLLLRLSQRLRAIGLPAVYARVLFGSNIEVVLGLLAFIGLVTYLFVYDPGAAADPLLTTLFGSEPPVAVVYVSLLVLWDVCYRIGTGWWTAVVTCWAAIRLPTGPGFGAELRRVSLWNVGFAALQLGLVPFVWGRDLLVVAIVGHVAAVVVVSAITLLAVRRHGRSRERRTT
jgi:hypothetical protein